MKEPFVLIVEDDLAHAKLVEAALHEVGVALEVTHVTNGEAGLRVLADALKRDQPPSSALVVLDLGLPGIDGLDVLTKFKQFRATRHIPIIVCSGSDDPVRLNQALIRHANAVVAKTHELQPFLVSLGHVAASFLRHTVTLDAQRD